MRFLFGFLIICGVWYCGGAAHAVLPSAKIEEDTKSGAVHLAPHKALYDINLVATRSGSQIVNIKGKMFYEWKKTCEGYITDHRFQLKYEYTDSPALQITSDFSTYEMLDGSQFNFSSRRKRNQDIYEEYRGAASVDSEIARADYKIPEAASFEFSSDAYFPMGHTVEMIRQASMGNKFFNAVVFDGSDDEGPVEINTFIGKGVNPMALLNPSKQLDMELLNNKAWKVQMAVFPVFDDAETSDYEMEMVFHENGVISDMFIDYDDFSVTQKLVALEAITGENPTSCQKQSSLSKITN